MEELLADPQFNNFLILFYKLRDLSGVEWSNAAIKTEAQLKKLKEYIK
jgi:hypothetical protein